MLVLDTRLETICANQNSICSRKGTRLVLAKRFLWRMLQYHAAIARTAKTVKTMVAAEKKVQLWQAARIRCETSEAEWRCSLGSVSCALVPATHCPHKGPNLS